MGETNRSELGKSGGAGDRNSGRLDVLGTATANVFNFAKRHTNLRSVAMSTIAASARAVARIRHPFGGRSDSYVVEPSTSAWASSRDDVVYLEVLSEERSINPPPKSVKGIVDWEYEEIADVRIPRPFVADIERGHAVGDHGVVVGPDGSLLHDLSLPVGGLRSFIWKTHGYLPDEDDLAIDWRLPPRRLRGTAALLTSYVGRGYFHWMFDVLPRLKLLSEAGYPLDEIDHFIVPSYFAEFQIESLSALGIPRDRVVSSLVNRHVVADRLLAPSLVRQTGLVPKWACDFLRDAFPPQEPKHVDLSDRVYLYRKITDHGFVSDEVSMLEVLEQRGFSPLATESLTFAEKAWVFDKLEAVIAAEGGGLSNIVFSQPGTMVFELRVRDLPAMDYAVIANWLGLELYDVYGDGYTRDEGQPTVEQGPVRAQHVLETFEMAGLTS